jgi:S-adenosylmethionine synthetase
MENLNKNQYLPQISECFSLGNSNKLCDYIADTMLDAIL